MNIFRAPKSALLITLVTVATLLSASTASAALTFNPSSITIASGQTASVSISGGDGNYYAASNSNSSAVQMSLNGANLNVTANGNTGDSATISICSATDPSNCGNITVSISSSGTNNNNNNSNNNSGTNPPTFSQNSINMNPGSTQVINISGVGNYFITNTSNSAVAQGSISGSSIVISAGNSNGNSTITVCQSGGCGNIQVTVGGGSTTTNSSGINFSQNNFTIAPNTTQSVTVSGGTGIYNLSSNSNPIALVATMSNNSVTMTGTAPGTAIITVCDSANTCGTLNVTVGTTNTTTQQQTQTTTQTQTNSSNIPQSFAQALLAQILAMESQLTQFQNQLAQLKSSLQNLVSANYGTLYTTPTASSVTSAALGHVFLVPLDVGDSGAEVTALQNRLTADGYYSGPITGYYGSLTETAVKKFQAANGIPAQGNVGPSTRAALNSQ